MRKIAKLAAALLIGTAAACSPGAEGRVLDVDGHPQAGCVVGACRLFDDGGGRVEDPRPVLMSSGADGSWSLDRLAPGTQLIFAWQPSPGVRVPDEDDVIAMARAFAKGIVPASGRYARAVTEARRNTTTVGLDLELGLYSGEGVHLAGHLSGPRLTDRLDYVVSVSVMRGELTTGSDHGISIVHSGPGRLMRTATFVGTADGNGHFDLGWVLSADLANLSVSAVPNRFAQLAHRSLALDHDVDDADVAIPQHEIRRVRVTGAEAAVAGDRQVNVRFWEPGDSNIGGMMTVDGDLQVLVPAGGMLFQATSEDSASRLLAVEPTEGGIGGDIVLDLLPEPRREVTLVDESGDPIAGGWIFIGTEATTGFTEPHPVFSVTDYAGHLTNLSLPPGTYPAQLVHEKGSYEEWRVDFDITVDGPRNTITVPLSSKYSIR